MIAFEKALELILTDVAQTGTEQIALDKAIFRVLAEDIFSDTDMPPFNKSAMDGYACRRDDLDKELQVLEVVAAGAIAKNTVSFRTCIKVMTGAKIPDGADTVIMVEHTAETRAGHIRFTGTTTPANIAYKAEDVSVGDRVLVKGTQILPQHIAVLASVGCVRPAVKRQPRVAVLSTGDELVEPEFYPNPGMIRNSNGPQLVAQITAAHCCPAYMGIIPDNEQLTRKTIEEALTHHDVVVLSGGVSMGDYDFVPKVLHELGVDIIFQKVAIKPGRPTIFGRTKNAYVFGLPGNPVSSFINFEVMVKPLLYKMMGCSYQALGYPKKLGMPFFRKKNDRPEWLPVTLAGPDKVVPVSYHGSAHIHAITMADGLIFIPLGIREIAENETVTFHPLSQPQP